MKSGSELNKRESLVLNEKFNLFENQDYEAIKEDLLKSGELFEDEEFVPGDEILTNDIQGKTIRINYMGKTRYIVSPRKKEEIKWLRPKVFIISILQCFDIKLC